MPARILRFGGNGLNRENPVVLEDIRHICSDTNINWSKLTGKTVLVTGSTGLIGKLIVKALCAKDGIHVIAMARNQEKAEACFAGYTAVELLICDISSIPAIEARIDYIIHCASVTDSKQFVQQPVTTFLTAVNGTDQILKLAVEKQCAGVVYTSSMEVYGTPQTDEKITEQHPTNLDCMNVRACYPESKRACENLCCAYASQYGIPIMTARLTQTFGAGVAYRDGRVFAEFARCAVENRNIILHTKGETKRSYLYTSDAVRAILTILTEGQSCHAYNVANEDTYCAIYEMAQMVAQNCGSGIQVECIPEDISKFGYAAQLHMNLDTSAIRALRWQAAYSLPQMYERMIASWNSNEGEHAAT